MIWIRFTGDSSKSLKLLTLWTLNSSRLVPVCSMSKANEQRSVQPRCVWPALNSLSITSSAVGSPFANLTRPSKYENWSSDLIWASISGSKNTVVLVSLFLSAKAYTLWIEDVVSASIWKAVAIKDATLSQFWRGASKVCRLLDWLLAIRYWVKWTAWDCSSLASASKNW